MISLHSPTAVAGSTTDVRRIPAAQIDAFVEALNEQFPNLVEESLAPYQMVKASQADPKGNVCIWRASNGIHAVTLTGALTSLAF